MRAAKTYAVVLLLAGLAVLCILNPSRQDYRQLRAGLGLGTPEATALEYVSARLCGDQRIALACSTDDRARRLSQPQSQPDDDPVWPGKDAPADRQQMRELLGREGHFDCRDGKLEEVRCTCWVMVDGQRECLMGLTLVKQQGLWLVSSAWLGDASDLSPIAAEGAK